MTGGYLPKGMQPSGELTARTPSLDERAVDWLRSLLFTDDMEGTQKAERLLNLGSMSPAGLAFDAYDTGKAAAQGDVPGMLMSMILTLPGASSATKNTLKKMQGNRSLLEMFEKTNAWMDPETDAVKTMIGPDGNKDAFTSLFYNEINGLRKPQNKKISDYIALDSIAKDPNLGNLDFRIFKGMSPYPNEHNLLGYYDDSKVNLFPDHIRTQLYDKSERTQLNDIKGITFHELTHGSQDKAGVMEPTSDDYFTNYLQYVLDDPTNHLSPRYIDKLIDLDEEVPKWGITNLKGDYIPASIMDNEKKALDFMSYWFHPLEQEARASEDMLTKPLEERAKSYLGGVDSSFPRMPYKTPERLIDMLHKLFVTGELSANQVRKAP